MQKRAGLKRSSKADENHDLGKENERTNKKLCTDGASNAKRTALGDCNARS